MKSLYLRIYATVVAVLLLFAFASGFVVAGVTPRSLPARLDSARGQRTAH